MQIDSIDDVTKLLNEMNELFYNFSNVEKGLKIALANKELERDDYLHEIKLSKLNAIERSKIYTNLETVLKERRAIKDKLELTNTIKPYVDKFIQKGIYAETCETIKNIQNLKSYQENRKYTARIVKNLKCDKRNKGEKQCNT